MLICAIFSDPHHLLDCWHCGELFSLVVSARLLMYFSLQLVGTRFLPDLLVTCKMLVSRLSASRRFCSVVCGSVLFDFLLYMRAEGRFTLVLHGIAIVNTHFRRPQGALPLLWCSCENRYLRLLRVSIFVVGDNRGYERAAIGCH